MTKTRESGFRVVNHKDKRAALNDFIHGCLARDVTLSPVVTLLVRSVESPAFQAFVPSMATIARRRVSMRLLLLTAQPQTFAAIAETLGFDATADVELRSLSDARTHEAHEQLVLGPSCVWIGDCMRRDPAARDAYEKYSDTCPETALFAQRSFNRLWPIGRAIRRPEGLCLTPDRGAEDVTPPTPSDVPGDAQAARPLGTQH
jgi:hypothetical protein